MSRNEFIDAAGFAGKAIIESGTQTREEKEWEKFKVDVASAVIKELCAEQEKIQRSNAERWMIRVKDAADKFGLTRVVILPGTDSCGKGYARICMYGGDTKSFCQALNITGVSTNFSDSDIKEIQRQEKQAGVVIYEKRLKA